MGIDPAGGDPGTPEPAPKLPWYEWVALAALGLVFVYNGIHVLATHRASPGRGFGRGEVTLGPAAAWFMGLTQIVGGLALPFGLAGLRRKQLREQAAKEAQAVADLAARGMTREAAERQLAEERRAERAAARKEGVVFVCIGAGLMAGGLVWVVVSLFAWHSTSLPMLGVVAAVLGKFQFFWPGVRRMAYGRRPNEPQ